MALTGTVCLTVGLWPCGSCGEKTGMAKHAHACLPVNGRTDGLSKDESKRAPFRCDFTNHFTSAINTARETGKRSECGRPAKEQVLHGGERWVGRSVGRSVCGCGNFGASERTLREHINEFRSLHIPRKRASHRNLYSLLTTCLVPPLPTRLIRRPVRVLCLQCVYYACEEKIWKLAPIAPRVATASDQAVGNAPSDGSTW